MANSIITINGVDNELYIIAYQAFASFQLAHIQTSYNPTVNVVVTVAPTTDELLYAEPATLVGWNEYPGSPVVASYTVYVPAGTYNIVGICLNWGSMNVFSFSIDGSDPLTNDATNTPSGTIWNSGQAAAENQIVIS